MHDGVSQYPIILSPHEIISMRRLTIDDAIMEWLDEKHKNTESKKTLAAYRDAITDFRAMCRLCGHDLDGDPVFIAPIARRWCDHSRRLDSDGKPLAVAPATFNQRRSILSSFYAYVLTQELVRINPIDRVSRRKGQQKDAARPISEEKVLAGMGKINSRTLEGKRDSALIAVALTTGRRVSELAGLRYRHLERRGNKTHVIWERCKGNTTEDNLLDIGTTNRLYDYLQAVYGDLNQMQPESPVWVSCSRQNRGQAISTRTIQRIWETYLGTSKVHATRHTFAVTMAHDGASLAEIAKGLGHKNLGTTSRYLEELLGYENPHARKLEERFGI